MKFARASVEDFLSELVLRKITSYVGDITLSAVDVTGGYGKIKKQIRSYNRAARSYPFIILTDLDKAMCPTKLKTDWLYGDQQEESLLFRIVVREIETWLVADTINFASFLNISHNHMKLDVELILDPKLYIFSLVNKPRVPREIKRGILPSDAEARVGPNYNFILGDYIAKKWDIDNARARSNSLERAIKCFEAFREK